MTVTTTLNYKQYQADGIATTFAIPFLLLNRNDLLVYLDNQLITTGYTVTGLGEPIGSITFNQPPTGILLLQRSITLLRDTDYQENGDLLATTLNRDFDRLYLALQGFLQSTTQTLRVSDAGGVNELPLAAYRANKLLGFGANGQPLLTAIASGSALELAQSLADTSDLNKGAGLVGYNGQLLYLKNTVGYGLNTVNQSVSTLTTKTNTLTTKVTALEESQSKERFTIIYPNGGTTEKPANVSANNRYILDNPFPKQPVIVVAEVFLNNVWGETGWLWSQYGYGTHASHLLESDSIIVQTGSGYVAHSMSSYIGASHGSNSTALVTTALCRVKVWRV